MKSQEALQKIVKGIAKFQTEVFPQQQRLFQRLAHGQQPIAMFFACADSRIVSSLVMQTGPGDIFVERTPGNIVPRYSDHMGGITASVEYALQVLKVPLLIVCGHSDCGVMKALLHPEKASGLPALQSWMRYSMEARDRLLRDHPGDSEEERLRRLTQYNVLLQLEHLKTHPAVEARLGARDLEVHGWVYEIATGKVFAAQPDSGAFDLLTEQSSNMPKSP